MDFKVTGTRRGITALQMDIKIDGLTREILEEALEQARAGPPAHPRQDGRRRSPAPRDEVAVYAPRIVTVQIKPDKIRDIIGPGGKTIRAIQEQTGAQIDINDNGTVDDRLDRRRGHRAGAGADPGLTMEPEVGQFYNGIVKQIVEIRRVRRDHPGHRRPAPHQRSREGAHRRGRGRAQRGRRSHREVHQGRPRRQDPPVAQGSPRRDRRAPDGTASRSGCGCCRTAPARRSRSGRPKAPRVPTSTPRRRPVRAGARRAARPTGHRDWRCPTDGGPDRAAVRPGRRHGITCSTRPATIDADYRGEIPGCARAPRTGAVHYCPGERIAQLVLAPVVRAGGTWSTSSTTPPAERAVSARPVVEARPAGSTDAVIRRRSWTSRTGLPGRFRRVSFVSRPRFQRAMLVRAQCGCEQPAVPAGCSTKEPDDAALRPVGLVLRRVTTGLQLGFI